MDFESISFAMGQIFRNPVLFLGYTVAAFLIVASVFGTVAYTVSCTVNKKTEMKNFMRVNLALNVWPTEGDHAKTPKLDYGEFMIPMQDPADKKENRLDPPLNWVEKALCRKYSVGILLERFSAAFDRAGFYRDPSSRLLKTLLEDDNFCNGLGTISRRNDKKGLSHQGKSEHKKEEHNIDQIRIYQDLSKDPAEIFQSATGCEVKNLCITLEYLTQAK